MSAEKSGKLKVDKNILRNAMTGDEAALSVMFKQFVGEGENVLEAHYMGRDGIMGFGQKSFGCVTDNKLAALKIGWFGQMIYQDGYLEKLETGAIFQPSILGLYIISIFVVAGTLGIGILLLPFISRLYYRLNKSGLVATINVGFPIYIFANRSKLVLVNRLWRRAHAVKMQLQK